MRQSNKFYLKVVLLTLCIALSFCFTMSENNIVANAATSFTVKKGTDAELKALHNQLMKATNEYFNVTINGTGKAALKKFDKYNKRMKKINKQGVIMRYYSHKSNGNKTTFTISIDNYKYTVLIAQKIRDNFAKKSSRYLDYKKYNNTDEWLLHVLYQELQQQIKNHAVTAKLEDYSGVYARGYIVNPTDYEFKTKNYCISPSEPRFSKLMDCLIKSATFDTSMRVNKVTIYTYDEFKANFKKLNIKLSDVVDYDTYFMQVIPYVGKDFDTVSDAIKVLLIDQFALFNGNGMRYKSNVNKYSMKLLYENNALGVCQAFAELEEDLFKNFGMTAYFKLDSSMYHAWSVVIAKNSKGKKLYIPFDYGIGPGNVKLKEETTRSDFIINNENYGYGYYLANDFMKVPRCKNFDLDDFN